MALTAALTFFLFIKVLEIQRYRVWLSALFGSLLIAGTTLMQGIDIGFYAPVSGTLGPDFQRIAYSLTGGDYYHHALQITDPLDFLGRFGEIQLTLNSHSHTHPPGAILVMYFLEKLVSDPALIGMLIMIISTFVTSYFFYKLVAAEGSDVTARYMAFLITLLPAVQIYYLTTIDALVTAALTGALYFFCFGKGVRAYIGAWAFLTSGLMLTFGALFLMPVMLGFDLIVRKSVRRSLIVISSVFAGYMLIYLFTGYDAWSAFREASRFENPNGFRLFAGGWSYIFTRIENVAEITLFFGPFLFVLLIRGLLSSLRRPLNVLAILGCATLASMFLTGAWHTGETARACMFIYPYLLLPVALYIDDANVSRYGLVQLAGLVFLQSVGMQFVGDYYW